MGSRVSCELRPRDTRMPRARDPGPSVDLLAKARRRPGDIKSISTLPQEKHFCNRPHVLFQNLSMPSVRVLNNLRQETTRQMCRCLEKEAEVGLGEGSHFSLVVRAWVPAFPLDFHFHAGLYSLAYRSTPHGRCARCTLSYPRHSPARPALSHASG
jgi:hypothetical protein